ncbi:hypothetical protein [Pseudomonas sp.]|uniref:deoxynucleotide monophosphate kinase family protein n=1 Tax=Pseudomonas sp. TaxID=306 RepID=UPI0037C7575F
MSKPILAFNSIRGKSGKDTLIEHIEASGLKVHRVAFADNLKRECSLALSSDPARHREPVLLERDMHTSAKDAQQYSLSITNIPRSEYKAWLLNQVEQHEWNIPRSLRWHLQQYGTEYIREHLGKPDYWLDQGILDVLNGLSDPSVDLVVVTDMRLPNEYDELSAIGAHRLRIVRNWHIPEVDTVPYHQSDIALMAHPFDALVVNEWGKPEDMLDKIEEFL